MKEYLTEAFVLGVACQGEEDRVVDLFTKELGRITAKVVGGRKILSKFSPHLNVLNFVTIRLVKKKNYTVADAFQKKIAGKNKKDASFLSTFLKFRNFIRYFLPFRVPDLALWYFFLEVFKRGSVNYKKLLTILGYNPADARCDICRSKNPQCFDPTNHVFICLSCFRKFRQNGNIHNIVM